LPENLADTDMHAVDVLDDFRERFSRLAASKRSSYVMIFDWFGEFNPN